MDPKKIISTALVAAAMLSSATLAASPNQFFDFEENDAGFTPIFADYPAGEGVDAFYELQHQWTTLPTNDGKGLYLSGNNHSDDLFMGYYKKLTGLKPGQLYQFQVTFRLATKEEGGMIGVGGSPGSSVYVKGGITTEEPQRTPDALSHYQLNVDKGNQGAGGRDLLLLGNLEKEDEQVPGAYEWKNFQFTMQAKANANGSVYLTLGTDSGFEATSSYYLDDISVTWTETQEGPITRGAALQMMYDTVQPGQMQEPTFSDVGSTSPYRAAVGWAQAKGIVNGYSAGKFGAEDALTVPQAMAMLYRYAGSPKVEANEGLDVPVWAKNCVSWGLQKGLITSADVSKGVMSGYAFSYAWQSSALKA